MQNELLDVITEDNFILNGLYKSGDGSKPAVILIHGFTSDFFTHRFFHSIQESLSSVDIANVAIQTRGTGIRSEIMRQGREESEWIGSFYEKLEEAHLDISAWVEFLLDKGHKQVILAGHSLGTIKAVRYLSEGRYKDKVAKLVLLAPFDKNGYLQSKNDGDKWYEYVKEAEVKIAGGHAEDPVPDSYDDFPMSYRTFLSWYQDNDLSNMFDFYRGDEYNFPILNGINVPVQVIVGDQDDFFYLPKFSTQESTIEILQHNIANLDLHVIKGSGHSFVGFEGEIAKLASDFSADSI